MITVTRHSTDRYNTYPRIDAQHGVALSSIFRQYQDTLGLNDNMIAMVNQVTRDLSYVPQNGDVVEFREATKSRG